MGATKEQIKTVIIMLVVFAMAIIGFSIWPMEGLGH